METHPSRCWLQVVFQIKPRIPCLCSVVERWASRLNCMFCIPPMLFIQPCINVTLQSLAAKSCSCAHLAQVWVAGSVSTLALFNVFLSFFASQGKQCIVSNACLIAYRINLCLVCCNSCNCWKILTALDCFKIFKSKFRGVVGFFLFSNA